MADKPWVCALCGTEQEARTVPLTRAERKAWGQLSPVPERRTYYSNADWYWVVLEPGTAPVHIDGKCFREHEDDRPDYTGTWETSAWQPGRWTDADGRDVFVWAYTAPASLVRT